MAIPRGGPGRQESSRDRTPGVRIPEDVSEFYSNSTLVAFTPWDFVLLFGSLGLPSTFPAGTGAQTIQGATTMDAVIRMSPQHAKATLRALQSTVQQYEEQFGEIRIPPEVQDAHT